MIGIGYIWRAVVVLAGVAVIAAATHVNVLHAGGYETGDAWLIIAIAALLSLGMAYAAICWQEKRRIGAVLLALSLLCGEAYWLATNAEREIAKRDEIAQPLLDAKARYAKAEARVAEAKAAVETAALGAQKRLEAAQKAKQDADAAAVSEAAKPGCRANCAKLLMDAKDRAGVELKEARSAMTEARAKAEADVKAAESALAAMPTPRNAAPLPEKLGMAPWLWDILMALLRSFAVIGGSIAVALALHPQREEIQAHRETQKGAAPAAPSAPVALEPVPIRDAKKRSALPPPRPNEQEHVAAFLRAALRPDPEGSASLRRLHARYVDWCGAQTLTPLPPAVLGQHLRTIVDAIGLEVEPDGQDVVVRGAALAA